MEWYVAQKLDRALRTIHFPKNWQEKNSAEQRLKFDELFLQDGHSET